jgi:hypothetical protein
MDLRIAEDLCLGCNLPGALKRKLDKAGADFARLLTRAITRGQGLAAVRPSRTSRGGLLPRRGFLCRWSLLPGSHLRIRRIEGIFDGLACVEPHSLAGCDLDVSPVCGFRPWCAGRAVTLKMPRRIAIGTTFRCAPGRGSGCPISRSRRCPPIRYFSRFFMRMFMSLPWLTSITRVGMISGCQRR